MKIRIEIDQTIAEEEIVIRGRELSEELQRIQRAIIEETKKGASFVFYKNEKEYYFPLDDILFFETEGNIMWAHTAGDLYKVRYKLYELEELLPSTFIRISKSTIVNVGHIYSIERGLSSVSTVQFQGTHKQVYVSRHYYKLLRDRMEEKRLRL